MSLQSQAVMMARYNLWANKKLISLLKVVPDSDYFAHAGVVFRSIHGTLSHIYLAEVLWYNRMTGADTKEYGKYWGDSNSYAKSDSESVVWESAVPDRLELEKLFLLQSEKWVTYVESLSEEKLASEFTYRNTSNVEFTSPTSPILSHIWNHSTWHRGQISAAMTGKGYPPPELDLLYYIRPNA